MPNKPVFVLSEFSSIIEQQARERREALEARTIDQRKQEIKLFIQQHAKGMVYQIYTRMLDEYSGFKEFEQTKEFQLAVDKIYDGLAEGAEVLFNKLLIIKE